jgi:V8-like Glu-specific endopeptidase
VLIGPDAVLTAAHCVWDAWRGGFHNSLRFAAGRHNASGCAVSSPFGAVQWRHITMFASFADSLEPDLAVVRLAVPVGLYTGWAGVRATACGDAQPLRVQLVGYGASGDGSDGDGGGGGQGDAGASFLPGSCLQSSCEVGAACGPGGGSGGSGNEGGASEGATTVDHTCDAQPGQSGSPMVDDEGYVRLVHRAGTLAFDGRAAGGGNAATLITPHILAALGQW